MYVKFYTYLMFLKFKKDAAILVIAATDGVMPQTKEHLSLAKAIGVKHIVVYINKSDLADKEMLELVEMEVRELLNSFGYEGDQAPVIQGSALSAIENKNEEMGKNSILKLIETLDTYVPSPARDLKSPFLMPIEKTVTVPGRGQVLVGTILRGQLKKGDSFEIAGFGRNLRAVATEIHIFKSPVNECIAGEHVGILARGVKPEMITRGMMAALPNSVTQTDQFDASVYMLTKEEGGRKKPILTNYIQPLFTKTCTLDCLLTLPPDRTMLLGGEYAQLNILLKYPMVILPGDRFTG